MSETEAATDGFPTEARAARGQEQGGRPLGAGQEPAGGEASLIEEELLVEEVSIDGMCGVY
ncbi:mycofactocin precursor MftA [Streptomyces sp. NPDC053560]|uniref:mycofactocin precursor MftA n=1 Tax=Streptomyces sp. NPDC053560 TaxID=3365711 RepID=UPI0037CFC566